MTSAAAIRCLDAAGGGLPFGGHEVTFADACPGCGVVLARYDGPTHAYMVSSPACWAAFGKVVAADYSSPERMAFHQLVVDAYAAQHPGGDGPRQVRSVALHLMTLCLFLDHDVDPGLGPSLHRRMTRRPESRRLARSGPGDLTVTHVPASGPLSAARTAAYEWARSVWDTYAGERSTIYAWLQACGFDVGETTPE